MFQFTFHKDMHANNTEGSYAEKQPPQSSQTQIRKQNRIEAAADAFLMGGEVSGEAVVDESERMLNSGDSWPELK
jgi:hypothetical protein